MLKETTVQKVAMDFLVTFYRRKTLRGNIYAQLEARTKKKHGGKRADGLLAFKHLFGGTFVVAMEAKSFKTLAAIKPYLDTQKFLLNCLVFSLMIGLASGALYALFRMDDGFFQFLVPLWVCVISGLLYGIISYNSARHQTMKVIAQLKQYPAHAQWLAFSQDSLEAMPKKKLKKLKAICKGQGIGVISVNKRHKAKVLIYPPVRFSWRKNYLKYYSKEKAIMAGL